MASSSAKSVLSETLLVIAALTVLAAGITYPLVSQLGAAIPGGLADPLLNAWILAWDAGRFKHGFAGIWDAPVFYPYKGTLTYSEHLIGIALFTAPIQWLSGNMVLAYNAAFIGSYVLAGGGMYLLVRYLTGRRAAAAVAALAFAFSPYRAAQVTHLQVLASGWMPIGLWALHRYFTLSVERASVRWRMLLVFAAASALQALSNAYYAYFFAVPVVVVAAVELYRVRGSRLRAIAELCAAGAVAAIALAPVALAYFEVRHARGLVRRVEDIASYSADLSSYLAPARDVRLWRGVIPSGEGELALFVGFTTLVLSMVALAATLRGRSEATLKGRPTTGGIEQRATTGGIEQRATTGGIEQRATSAAADQRALVFTYWAIAIVAVILSLGPFPTVWGMRPRSSGPYGWLMAVIPGLDGVRVPARLAMIVALALAVLAGMGVAWLASRLSPLATRAIVVGACAAILLEGCGAPLTLSPYRVGGSSVERAAYRWLGEQPAGAVLELPIAPPDQRQYARDYHAATLLHGRPIVNGGYSGYRSPLQEFLSGPPTPLADTVYVGPMLGALRSLGVRYVLLHRNLYDNPRAVAPIEEAIQASADHIAQHREFGPIRAWALKPLAPRTPAAPGSLGRVPPPAFTADASAGADRLPLAFDGNPQTRWLSGTRQSGNEWIELRFDRPRPIARVDLEIGRRSLADYPRELEIQAIQADGSVRTLHEGSVLPPLFEALVRDEEQVRITIDVPPTQAMRLRLRQTGRTRTWFWSIHELTVWEVL